MNLTPKELAEKLRVSTRTLKRWRRNCEGPPYAKFGSRVIYPLAPVEVWLEQRLVKCASEVPART